MAKATYDDANLILRLYDMRREEKMRAARAWFVGNFKPKTLEEMNQLCPPGSDHNAMMRQVLTYWDLVASLITSGVLHQELFFESGRELLVVWIRVEPLVAQARAANSDPSFLRNLETVGKAYAEHLDKTTTPQTYKAFKARIGG